MHKPMFSHNSSLTSSNASSYHGATFGSYTPGSQEQRDLVGEWEEDDSSRGHEDIFMFDKLDELNGEDIHYKRTESTDNSLVRVKHLVSGRQDLEGSRRTNQSLCHSTDSSQVGNSKIATCSRCGKLFDVMGVDEEGIFCDVCASKVGNIFTGPTVQTIGEENQQYGKTANLKPCIASDPPIPTDGIGYSKEVSLDHQLVNSESYTDCLDQDPPIHSMGHTPQEILLGQEEKIDAEHRMKHVGDSLGNINDISFHRSSATECEQTEPTSVGHDLFIRDQMDNHNHGLSQFNETVTSDNSPQLGSTTYQNPKLETTEGTGISILLVPKSNSNKWPVVEGRALAATSILCSESYYARDGVSMMKHSFGLDSTSAASSSDLGSSRQSTICFERLRSGKRGDFEKSQMSSTMSRQSIASVSDMSVCSSSASLCPQSDSVGGSCFPIDTLESSTSRTLISSEENDAFCKDALPSAMECSSSSQVIADDDSPVDLKIQSYLSEVGDTTVENHSAGRMADMDHTSTNMYSLDTEMRSDTRESSGPEESCMPEIEEDTYAISQCNKGSAPEHSSDENNFDDIQMQSEIVQGSAEENRLDDCCMSAISEEDVLISGQETDIRKLPNDGMDFCILFFTSKSYELCLSQSSCIYVTCLSHALLYLSCLVQSFSGLELAVDMIYSLDQIKENSWWT